MLRLPGRAQAALAHRRQVQTLYPNLRSLESTRDFAAAGLDAIGVSGPTAPCLSIPRLCPRRINLIRKGFATLSDRLQ